MFEVPRILKTALLCSVAILFRLGLGICFAEGELQYAELGDLRLANGEVIRDCRVGYRVFGQPKQDGSNVVVFPTWFTGQTEDLIPLIGPNALVDSSRFAVIAVDALGNGVSSSPSNSLLQPGTQFPRFTIQDMVTSQYLLLTRKLGFRKIRAVVGISMGGMQAFQWIVQYPDFVERAVPIVGSPRLASSDLLLWTAELRVLDLALRCQCDLDEAMKAVAAIHSFALETPGYRARETPPEKFSQYLASRDQRTLEAMHPLDWAAQLRAMLAHDISKQFGGDLKKAAASVKARLLVVVATQDHMVNPLPAIEFARLAGAELLELSTPCGHLAPSCEADKLRQQVNKFLAGIP